MSRTKRGVTSRARHKKVLKAVKGQWGRRKNTIRVAKQAMEKAMQYAYRDRKAKKRDFRSLWIQRINAGVRTEGLTYSRFINGLRVTDKNIINIVEEVLIDFNNDIVDSLKKLGTEADSFHTKQDNIIEVEPERKELGFVGIPKKIKVDILVDK